MPHNTRFFYLKLIYLMKNEVFFIWIYHLRMEVDVLNSSSLAEFGLDIISGLTILKSDFKSVEISLIHVTFIICNKSFQNLRNDDGFENEKF